MSTTQIDKIRSRRIFREQLKKTRNNAEGKVQIRTLQKEVILLSLEHPVDKKEYRYKMHQLKVLQNGFVGNDLSQNISPQFG